MNCGARIIGISAGLVTGEQCTYAYHSEGLLAREGRGGRVGLCVGDCVGLRIGVCKCRDLAQRRGVLGERHDSLGQLVKAAVGRQSDGKGRQTDL